MSDWRRRNPHTGRRMAVENWALALLCGIGCWRHAVRLAEKWDGRA